MHFYRRALASVPLFAGFVVFSTIAFCYALASDRFPSGLIFPAISQLGMENPEKIVYQIGFGFTGVVFFICILVFKQTVLPILKVLLPDQEAELNKAVIHGMICALGCTLQGIFTLEKKPGWQSYIHWGGALLFAAFARFHADYINKVYKHLRKELPEITATLGFKQMCIEPPIGKTFGVVLVFQMISGSSASALLMNGMGLMQWIVIGYFICYFLSYSFDIYYACAYFSRVNKKKTN